ncbi:hypothetical protein, partial [Microbulbifer celer]
NSKANSLRSSLMLSLRTCPPENITPCSAAAYFMHFLRNSGRVAAAQKVHKVRRRLQQIVRLIFHYAPAALAIFAKFD